MIKNVLKLHKYITLRLNLFQSDFRHFHIMCLLMIYVTITDYAGYGPSR